MGELIIAVRHRFARCASITEAQDPRLVSARRALYGLPAHQGKPSITGTRPPVQAGCLESRTPLPLLSKDPETPSPFLDSV